MSDDVSLPIDVIPLPVAAREINRHPSTLKAWCKRAPALGWPVAGRWCLDRRQFERVLRGTPLDQLTIDPR